MFENFRHCPTLEAMLTFSGWCGGFTSSDRDAMVQGLDAIRTAMVQPCGANASSKGREARAVSDVEFDAAVMRVITGAMCMWISGALGEVACDDDGR